METLEIRVPNKKARALLDQLAALGVISIQPGRSRGLVEVIEGIQKEARRHSPLREREIQAEVDAVRAKHHARQAKGRR